MRCAECGAPTVVRQTRPAGDGTVRRRRHCKNGHRTTTYEITAAGPASHPTRRALMSAVRTLEHDDVVTVLALVTRLTSSVDTG